MKIKELNQILENHKKKIEEKSSLSFSGNKQEVGDIVSKLDSEYGDLTIPEFIDMLIQKEKQGEDILDESLNESVLLDNFDKFYSLLPDKIKSSDGTDAGKIKYVMNMNETRIDYENSEGRLLIQVVCRTNQQDNIIDEEGINIYVGPYNGRYTWDDFTYHAAQKISDNWEYYPFKTKQDVKDTASEVTEKLEEIHKLAVSLKNASEQEQIEKENKIKNSFAELVKAKREARTNKNAANTTVKQALSKSAIAKKIQALQNPTPEQLARILAAIDEDFNEDKQVLAFKAEDIELLKELMRKFGPETSLKKVLDQIRK